MTIKWIGAHPNNFNSRYNNAIDKIVLHWIVGTLESADATFNNPTRYASAHYGVGDNDVHQYVKEDMCAWHAGNLMVNRQSIGIENEGGPDLPISEATYKTCASLVKDICERYNIPLDRDHIKGHKEISATQCPGTLDIDRVINLAKDNMTDLEKKAIDVLQKAVDTIEENGKPKYGNIESAARALADLVRDAGEYKKHIEALDLKVIKLGVKMETLSDSITRLEEDAVFLKSEIGRKDLRIDALQKIIDGYQIAPPIADPPEEPTLPKEDKNLFIRIWLLIKQLFKKQ